MERLIFHIDVNSAFLSWESVKRVAAGEEDLRLIPAAIGGDASSRRGIILAKSIPAKIMGVTTGEPVALALRKCPNLVLAKPDFELYRRNSRAFMDICREYAPEIEQYSIDECFCDFTGTKNIYPDPIAIAYEMKDKIRDKLGFTVNVGIGNSKLCAKMASDFQKPDKVHTLFDSEIESKMWPLPIGDLLFAGKSSTDKLIKAGILTIGDLARAEEKYIKALLGEKTGTFLRDYANGIDDSPVIREYEDEKSYSMATTLEENVETSEDAYKILSKLVDKVALRMRRDGAKAYCVSVNIRSTEFTNHSHQKRCYNATDVTDEILSMAKELFDELWDKKTPLRLIGVTLQNLTKDDFNQISLFDDGKKEKEHKLDKALDDIRSKFGMEAIKRGSQNDMNVGSRLKQ